ncbi:hypothetical protein ACFL09_06400, partial [Planctomycetota bacterium]
AKALHASLPELSEELTTALHEHPLRLREGQGVEAIDEDLVATDEALQKASAALTGLPRPLDLHEDSPQRRLLEDIADAVRLIEDVRSRIEDARAQLREGVQRVRGTIGEWRVAHEDHEKLYADAEQEARQHSQKLEGIKALRTQEAKLQRRNTDLEAEIAKLKNARAEFAEAWGSWTTAHTRQADLLEEQCRALTEKSDGEIQAELARGADFQRCVEELKGALAGCRIRDDRWETLSEHLGSGDTPQLWMQFMAQLRSLAEVVPDDVSPDGEPPKLDAWDLTPKMRLGIVQRLTPQAWLQVALVSLRDEPRFSYRNRAGELMPFRQASAGQQATALMKVLLKESSGPLIVDQPEDDLDNRVIQEIAQTIWAAKEMRQIIFASHNANLVVNGDAELVLHCDYVASGDRSRGTIAHRGAIDIPDVRDAITRVMEGGEEAFQLRRDKYGF